MRRTLLAVLALCCFATTAHAARGMNLRWDACFGGGGLSNRSFACDTNTGSEYLYVSFLSDTLAENITGIEGKIDFVPATGTLPSWWQLKNTGACRPNTLTMSVAPGSESAGCSNTWGPDFATGFSYYNLSMDGAMRLEFVSAVPTFEAMSFAPNQEWFAARFAISHAKTVGAGNCAGCQTPLCIGLHVLRLSRPYPEPLVQLSTETVPGGSTVSWQGGAVDSYIPPPPLGHNDPWPYRTVTCSLPVPARNHTWGSIKSLYH